MTMLGKKVRILNLDNSIIQQKKLLSQYENEIIDLTGFGPLVRNWMGFSHRQQIKERLDGSAKNAVTFLGSGDFHHLSELLISQFTDPLSVIIFDFHPDWTVLPPRFGCGSWVNEVLKKENILKLVLIGVSSSDISTFSLQTGNIKALEGNRVEIYPYQHRSSRVFMKKVTANVSIKVKKGIFSQEIYWQELKKQNLAEFFSKLLGRLPTKNVYVSLDKDCLSSEYALTNWEEGLFSLEELLLMLRLMREGLDIVGFDIGGDYSPVKIKGMIKRIVSAFDHPKEIAAEKFTEHFVTLRNEETNLKILSVLYP